MSFRSNTFDTSASVWDSSNTWWQVTSSDLEDRTLDGTFAQHYVAVEGLNAGQTYAVAIRFSGSSEFKTISATTALTDFVTISGMRVDAIRVTPGTGTGRVLVLQSVPKGFE